MGHYWILFLPLSSLYILAFHGVLRRNIEHREKNKKNLQYIVLPIFCVLFLREREREGQRPKWTFSFLLGRGRSAWRWAACCSPPGQRPTRPVLARSPPNDSAWPTTPSFFSRRRAPPRRRQPSPELRTADMM